MSVTVTLIQHHSDPVGACCEVLQRAASNSGGRLAVTIHVDDFLRIDQNAVMPWTELAGHRDVAAIRNALSEVHSLSVTFLLLGDRSSRSP